MKREEPSAESPRVCGREMWRTGSRLSSRSDVEVLLIVALPKAGVRPVRSSDAVASNFLGVGLFENAAQSGW